MFGLKHSKYSPLFQFQATLHLTAIDFDFNPKLLTPNTIFSDRFILYTYDHDNALVEIILCVSIQTRMYPTHT